ncbi:glycosyl hydrolase [Longispora albida]|uniref:glycosyl hydrolase n=1 Tax=Longispora albida TaxID=203523 RepID=UPI00037C61E1|nr:glycosyl hydrolase [Longispora albida]
MKRLLAASLAAFLVVTGLAGCEPADPPVEQPPGPPAALQPSGPVKVPDRGAYVGAWVRPGDYSDAARVEAITGLEGQLGRKLDIVHVYHKWTDKLADPADSAFVKRGTTLMISWAGADTRMVTSGRLDQEISAQAVRVRNLKKPVLLRYRWEMDRPNLRAQMWSPEDYIAAWRHVRRVFQQAGASNVSWVWCPTAEGFATGEAQKFYPGDEQVDWTCADAYTSTTLRPLSEVAGPFLNWAKARPKPIIIGEYGISKKFSATERAAWLRDAAVLFERTPRIKAVSYFNSDPEGNDAAHQYSIDGQSLAAFRGMATSDWFSRGRS